ncbi:DNA-3-methyladenine glycosylase family protein [Allopusillimonas ginsengisoli]|uniref:DNA-3-methyladenine glycosylase family protein n=1 Tax=Allopusillimonas ginsengisoli TaxID=453575 RepID=UPI0010C20BE0|nr:DNA-3-methyladenine glycosylase 2 family protein [Allopusillimonas ginsengisoli]
MPDQPITLAQRSEEAELHLRSSCKVMAHLVKRHGPCGILRRRNTAFQTLAFSIISQQLSARAAATIKKRVIALSPGFTPAGILSLSPESLRAAGLSSAKVRYITELAQRLQDGRLNFRQLRRQDDEDVIAVLTNLPGVGRWTAEMFLIFSLKRPDVLALGDVGLQRAVRRLYGEMATLETVSDSWRPYRSVASWYLWRSLDE